MYVLSVASFSNDLLKNESAAYIWSFIMGVDFF